MSLSLTEAVEQVRAVSEFSLVRVQPVLDALNNTLLLVVYNHCKYYRNASSSCCAFFLCYLKGLAGDFVYFIEVRAPCI